MFTERDIEKAQNQYCGRRFVGASLSRVNLGEKADDVVEWLQKGSNFLIYLGSPGIGKTYFCSALIPWIYGKFGTFRYWNERDLLSRLRTSISEEKGDYLKELDYLLDDEFIMIDDLGSSGITDWRKEVVFEAIDRRYESQLPTVITSNLTRKEIYEGFGPRIHSRMFARENLILEFHGGEDLRQNYKEGE